MRYVSPNNFLQIWADHSIKQSRCEIISKRVHDAYIFASKLNGWHEADILWDSPLQFRLVDTMDPKVLGYAEGANLMVVRDSFLDDETSEGTLAHELTHIQDARQLQGAKLPSFLLEGRALTIGYKYRMSLGQPEDPYDVDMALSVVDLTTHDAEEILPELYGHGWKLQAMGTFLVEYMRTKMNGTGVPDTQLRLSIMIETMGAGLSFEAAFEKEFSRTFKSLRESIEKYLSETEKFPHSRLIGTMWQPLIKTA